MESGHGQWEADTLGSSCLGLLRAATNAATNAVGRTAFVTGDIFVGGEIDKSTARRWADS